jgi:hypothetical protein
MITWLIVSSVRKMMSRDCRLDSNKLPWSKTKQGILDCYNSGVQEFKPWLMIKGNWRMLFFSYCLQTDRWQICVFNWWRLGPFISSRRCHLNLQVAINTRGSWTLLFRCLQSTAKFRDSSVSSLMRYAPKIPQGNFCKFSQHYTARGTELQLSLTILPINKKKSTLHIATAKRLDKQRPQKALGLKGTL